MVLTYLFRIGTRILSGYGLGRNRFIASLYYGLGRRMLPEYIIFNGHKIFLDSENSINLGASGYDSEKYALSLFESVINPEAVVLDVGANIGLYTLVAARRACRVYSFEPDPITCSNLRKNVAKNSYKNVTIVDKAVSDKSSRTQFSSPLKKTSRGSSHLISSTERTKSEFITVETVALDDFFADKENRVDVVKMDIEGAEFEALGGMKNLIKKNENIKLFLEFNPPALIRRGVDIKSFTEYISGLNLRLYLIDELEMKKKPVDQEWLLRFSQNRKTGNYINLFGQKNA